MYLMPRYENSIHHAPIPGAGRLCRARSAALSITRNLGRSVRSFSAADMDFIRHYRPRMNVIERPTRDGGHGFALTGHYEINFPLRAAAIRVALNRHPRSRSAAIGQQKQGRAKD
jgi:hypothetical protein